jgi:hypothetical protein
MLILGWILPYSELIVNRLEDEAGLKADGARWRSSWLRRCWRTRRGTHERQQPNSNCTTRPRRTSFATALPFLTRWLNDSKPLVLTIKFKTRTKPQNACYWGVLAQIAAQAAPSGRLSQRRSGMSSSSASLSG